MHVQQQHQKLLHNYSHLFRHHWIGAVLRDEVHQIEYILNNALLSLELGQSNEQNEEQNVLRTKKVATLTCEAPGKHISLVKCLWIIIIRSLFNTLISYLFLVHKKIHFPCGREIITLLNKMPQIKLIVTILIPMLGSPI